VRRAYRRGTPALFFTWQNLNRSYPPPFSWIERDVYRKAAFAIAGNQDAADVLRAKGYPGPLRVLPQFGVDPALHGRAVPPQKGAPFVIGYAGRLVPEKGISDLLHAAYRLSGDWELRLLGSGPERKRLQNLADALGIAERTRFEGQVPSCEMPEHLARLHALVLPSHSRPNWVEQFGRILVEAMASGVPVVGSDSGEIPNVIGDAGQVFPEGDVDALSECLQSLIDDPDRWMIFSQLGCDRAEKQFSQAQIAARTVEIYRQVLEAASFSGNPSRSG
jgi:glycosyltransferase involved in cell wall biosynthesis